RLVRSPTCAIGITNPRLISQHELRSLPRMKISPRPLGEGLGVRGYFRISIFVRQTTHRKLPTAYCLLLTAYLIRYPSSSLLNTHATTSPMRISSYKYASVVTAAEPRPRKPERARSIFSKRSRHNAKFSARKSTQPLRAHASIFSGVRGT